MVATAFFACHSWNQIYFLVYFLGGPVDFAGAFYNFTVVAEFLNCCINPYIYTLKYRDFQAALRDVVGKVVKRKPAVSDFQLSHTGTQ